MPDATTAHALPEAKLSRTARWRVVREDGVRYASPLPAAPSPLAYPVAAERAADGSTLIVDKLSLRKCVPFSHEFRTLRVARDGTLRYDSHAHGFDDAYGCLLRDGGMALLRVARWEVLLLSPRGQVVRTLDLSACAKRPPMLVTATAYDTLLVAFIDRLFDVEIVEIDLDGRLLWYLPPGAYRFGCPSSLQRLPNDHLLVVDEFCSTATEIDRGGVVVRQFGKSKDSSRAMDRLSNPFGARQLGDGRWLIADTRNHRVLEVGGDGVATLVAPRVGGAVARGEGGAGGSDAHAAAATSPSLCCPTSASALGDGRLLVCDAGNRRVIELDATGAVAWQYGDGGTVAHTLSFPRSVEPLAGGVLLVADTANDRVVEVLAEGGLRVWPMQDEAQLFWPRCARLAPAGTLLVADGRNSRVVEIARDGRLLNELRTLQIEGGLALADPHDVRLLGGGLLLLADASLDLVVIARWNGEVLWAAGRGHGTELKDPHSAQRLQDGSVLVCDTGRSRVLEIDAAGRVVREHTQFHAGAACYRFNRPRHAEITGDGTFLVVDTGNNRILGADRDGEGAWELAQLPDSPTPWINQPRWAAVSGSGELLVTDHLHHRVVRVVRSG